MLTKMSIFLPQYSSPALEIAVSARISNTMETWTGREQFAEFVLWIKRLTFYLFALSADKETQHQTANNLMIALHQAVQLQVIINKVVGLQRLTASKAEALAALSRPCNNICLAPRLCIYWNYAHLDVNALIMMKSIYKERLHCAQDRIRYDV